MKAQFTDTVTTDQIRAIFAAGRRAFRWNEDQTNENCVALYGQSVNALTQREASGYIGILNMGQR